VAAPSTIILLSPVPAVTATNAQKQVHFMDHCFWNFRKKIHVLQTIATQAEAT
jgi:hypothetical protein